LKICQKVGGVAAGAFAAGEPGGDGGPGGKNASWLRLRPDRGALRPPRPLVAHAGGPPAARDLGLGTRLKLYQRDLLLPLGVESVYWSFDPLEARNAHLNLHRLGGEIEEYVEEMYADEMGSELAKGIGTDRLIVDWQIGGEAGAPGARRGAAAGRRALRHGARGAPGGIGGAARGALGADRGPGEHQGAQGREPRKGVAWRAATAGPSRATSAAAIGSRPSNRDRATGRCFYGLEKG